MDFVKKIAEKITACLGIEVKAWEDKDSLAGVNLMITSIENDNDSYLVRGDLITKFNWDLITLILDKQVTGIARTASIVNYTDLFTGSSVSFCFKVRKDKYKDFEITGVEL